MPRLPPPPPRAAIRPAGQAASSDPTNSTNPWTVLAVVFGGLAIYEAIKYGLRKA